MRTLLLLLASATALAQTAPQTRLSRITEDLRGVSAVSQKVPSTSAASSPSLPTKLSSCPPDPATNPASTTPPTPAATGNSNLPIQIPKPSLTQWPSGTT